MLNDEGEPVEPGCTRAGDSSDLVPKGRDECVAVDVSQPRCRNSEKKELLVLPRSARSVAIDTGLPPKAGKNLDSIDPEARSDIESK